MVALAKPRDESGSVSIVAAAFVVMALVVAMGLAGVASALVVANKAALVADSVALAAAQEMAFPSGRTPLAVAQDYAARNGAILVRCDCSTGAFMATVEVQLSVAGMFLIGDRAVTRWSRAVVDLPQPNTP